MNFQTLLAAFWATVIPVGIIAKKNVNNQALLKQIPLYHHAWGTPSKCHLNKFLFITMIGTWGTPSKCHLNKFLFITMIGKLHPNVI